MAERHLVVVSAGFERTGGGRAAAGRLLAGALAEIGARRGLAVEALALGRSGSPIARTRYFGENRAALAWAVWRRQRRADGPAAIAFDLLGLARVQPLVPRRARAPYLVPLLGIDAWRRLSGLRRRAVALADERLAISHHTAERFAAVNGMRATAVLHLALEDAGVGSGGMATAPDAAPRIASELDAARPAGAASTPYVLIVGRLDARERYKGHDLLLDALAILAARGVPLRLAIAGDGDDRPRLASRARTLGLDGRVDFTGFVDDTALAALYRGATAFAMPSTGEGFGLVFLEAMRAGLPCIALRDTAPAEIVIDGETGLLVDAGDAAGLADALARLAADPALAARLGAAGRHREATELSRAQFIAGLEPLIDRLLATGVDAAGAVTSPAARGTEAA